MPFSDLLDQARSLDKTDNLRSYREQFSFPENDMIYLDGNSLGRLPIKTIQKIQEVMSGEWGKGLIRSWNEVWYEKASLLGSRLALLVGAEKEEVIISDSTTINLYKLAEAALSLQKEKPEIISDDLNFPSDLYILQGLVKRLPERSLLIVKSEDGMTIPSQKVADLITNDTALVVLSHVTFKSAYMYDMQLITRAAHDKGALVLWDLSHSAGVVPVNLKRYDVDLAIGCTYKYLNGGPGSPAFLYVRKDLQPKLNSPIQGWFGDESPFQFDIEYHSAEEIRKFLVGTPPILSLSAIEPALDMILEAGIKRIREKSIKQSTYLISMIKEHLLPFGFKLGSPEDPEQRGSHITIRHPEAYRITQAMEDSRTGNHVIIPDFREPDNIRLGISPLYTSYEEIGIAINEIKQIMARKWYLGFSKDRKQVT